MVSLPDPAGFSTTRPVQQNISGAEVASPYAQIAHSLDKAGEALNSVAVDQARKAGEEAGQKARVDDSGNLIIDKAPFLVGPAAPEYRRAATMSTAAKMQPQIENKMLELRLANPFDPKEFKRAADEYGSTLLDKIDDPHLKAGLGHMVAESAAHNFRTSLVEANNHNTSDALTNYQHRIASTNDETESIARQGGGYDPSNPSKKPTPEYIARTETRKQLWDELVGDKRFGVSRERADFEIKAAIDKDVVQGVIGDSQRLFQTKQNLGEAQRYLYEKFLGPEGNKLNLSPRQKEAAVAEGIKALSAVDAYDREAINENRRAVSSYTNTLMHDPDGAWNETQHRNMVEYAAKIGDTKSVRDLNEAALWRAPIANFMSLPPAERAKNFEQLAAGVVPNASSVDFLRARGARLEGATPQFAERLHAALADAELETGEPARINSLKRSYAEQSALKAKEGQPGGPMLVAAPGTSLHEVGSAADLAPGKVLDYLHANAGKYGLEFLKGDALAKDPTHIQMAKGDVPLPKPFGTPINMGADTPTTRLYAATLAIEKTQLSKDSDVAFAGLEKKFKEGVSFGQGEVADFIKTATLAGREDLIRKAAPTLEAAEASAKIPPNEWQAAISQAEIAKEHSDPVAYDRLTKIQDNLKKAEQVRRDNPLLYGSRNYGTPAINPLTPANPQAAVGELQNRQKSAALVQSHENNYGPVPLIGKDESVNIGNELTSGDSKAAAQFLTSLRTLPDDNYMATMAVPGIKDAVTNMSHSNDPIRMGAGMTAMLTMWQTNKVQALQILGGDAVQRMQTFRGLQGFMDASTLVEHMNRTDDPAEAASRTKRVEAVEKETEKMTPEDVAYQLGSSWGITPEFIGRAKLNPFATMASTPAVPPNAGSGIAADVMRNEYVSALKAFRADGLQPDKAQALVNEKMKTLYKPSEVAGGVLMRRAPELYYPTIDGNYEWMKNDLRDHMISKLGPQTTFTGGVEPGAVTENWKFSGLISDAQTEREVKAGKSPSYQIAITDAKGQIQLVPDRIAWNPGTLESGTEANAPFYTAPSGPLGADQARREQEFNAKQLRMRMEGIGPRGFAPSL